MTQKFEQPQTEKSTAEFERPELEFRKNSWGRHQRIQKRGIFEHLSSKHNNPLVNSTVFSEGGSETHSASHLLNTIGYKLLKMKTRQEILVESKNRFMNHRLNSIDASDVKFQDELKRLRKIKNLMPKVLPVELAPNS